MTREEIKQVKAGDVLTTKYGSILLVERVEFGEKNAVSVYDYFDYDEDMGIQMNEWLTGFYGPKFDEDFYRYATEEEKTFLLDRIREYGYELHEEYGKIVPRMTKEEFRKKHHIHIGDGECHNCMTL